MDDTSVTKKDLLLYWTADSRFLAGARAGGVWRIPYSTRLEIPDA